MTHSTDSLPSAVSDAIVRRDVTGFCQAILPAVSRTFALSIRSLQGELGQTVLDAYLLCRIVDTVEDASGLDPQAKARLFDDFLSAFDNTEAVDRFLVGVQTIDGDLAHVTLARNADLVFRHLCRLPPGIQELVRHWVTEMTVGMRKFVLLHPGGIRIRTLDEYREYCYYVAGTVGYMLTDLWHVHAKSIGKRRHEMLLSRCRTFAEALQTVNILKDVAKDAEIENSVYVPEELLERHGSTQSKLLVPALATKNRAAVAQLMQLASDDLDEALLYLLDVPRRAVSIRLFCIFPLLLAHATLRDLLQSSAMLEPGGDVKISRREVTSLLLMGALLAMSNRGVRWLVGRVRRRPFELAFIDSVVST